MAWPKGRSRRAVEQGNAVELAEQADAEQVAPSEAPADLEAFAHWAQRARLPAVLVALSHPDALERHVDGDFSGFRQSRGAVCAVWSDGSRHGGD